MNMTIEKSTLVVKVVVPINLKAITPKGGHNLASGEVYSISMVFNNKDGHKGTVPLL